MMMCRAATRLMSKQLDSPLSVREALTLRVHVMMCKACRRCQQQFGMLHDLGDPFIDIATGSNERAESAQHHRHAVAQAVERAEKSGGGSHDDQQ